ncbi:hypothetical protein HN51_025775 [Arachis hypogaea]|nr:uncharacterized protein DS421_7g215310 [Arachis hypogaea]
MLVKEVILFLIMMGFSATIETSRHHQQKLDPSKITTQMFNNGATSYYSSSQRETTLICMCSGIDVSCNRSCKNCSCQDYDEDDLKLCKCDDVRKDSCPDSCINNCSCYPYNIN